MPWVADDDPVTGTKGADGAGHCIAGNRRFEAEGGLGGMPGRLLGPPEGEGAAAIAAAAAAEAAAPRGGGRTRAGERVGSSTTPSDEGAAPA